MATSRKEKKRKAQNIVGQQQKKPMSEENFSRDNGMIGGNRA